MSALYFDARIDGAQLQKDIANINRQIGTISAQMKKEGGEIDAITRRIGTGLTSAFGVFAGGKFIKDIATVRGEFQQLNVAFETMLGSKAKADKLMAQVVDFAARTPFQLTDVASGTKQLLAYGIAAEDILPTLKSLGDVSAGLSVPIERLILNYGQVRTQLKLTGRELRDFNLAGVPLISELAKNLGVADDKIADMVERGKIGFPEVEKAFRSMTDEGGRFNNLMDKQSKTITGLASNFKDAWDKMLNAIGQQNEGIITGSIKGAIQLTEHYKDVIKILKILIATYGTYKAAVIATAVAQNASVAAGNIKAWFELARGIKTAKDAQIAFNLATKANPYALIAGAIAAVVTLLTVFGNKTKDAQDYVDDLNNSIKSIGTQANTNELIRRYDELKSQTKLTKEEQAELNKTVSELGNIFPEAITKVDEYGKSTELAKDKLVELNDQIRESITLAAKKDLADSQAELNKLVAERKKIQDEINAGEITVTTQDATGQYIEKQVKLTENGIELRRKKIVELTSEITKLNTAIGEADSKLQGFGNVNVERFKAQYRELFGDVTNLTKEQAEETKNSLEKLLVYQFGDEINAAIQKQIETLNNQIALPTIQQQIEETTRKLQEAYTVLDKLRGPGSQATETQITDQEKKIKDLQSTLEALTGVRKKDYEKQLKDQKKAREEQYNADKDYADSILELERDLQSSKIALMKEGADRQKAEAELAYQQELDRIKEQEKAYLEAYNAKLGFSVGDKGYVTELPTQALAQFDKLRVNAEQVKNNRIKEINKNTADQIKDIWSEVNSVFKTDTQNAIDAVNKKYDDYIQKIGAKVGSKEFNDINKARGEEISKIVNANALQVSEFYKKIFDDVEKYAANTVERLANQTKRMLDTAKQTTQNGQTFVLVDIPTIDAEGRAITKQVQITVEEFNRLQDKYVELKNVIQQKDPFKAIKASYKDLVEALKAKDKDSVSEAVGEFTSALASASDLVNEIGNSLEIIFGNNETIQTITGITQGVVDLGTGISQIATGDVVQGITNVLKGIASIYDKIKNAKEYRELAELKNVSESITVVQEQINKLFERRIELIKEATAAEAQYLNQLTQESIQSGLAYYEKRLDELANTKILHAPGAGSSNDYTLKQLMDDLGITTYIEFADWWNNGGLYQYMLNENESVVNEEFWNGIFAGFTDLIDKSKESAEATQEAINGISFDQFKNSLDDLVTSAETTGEDVAKSFTDTVTDGILQWVKSSYLNDALKQWYDELALALGDNVLTDSERQYLQNLYTQIFDTSRNLYDNALNIAGISSGAIQQQGLTGAIQNITEETAGLIAGQFYAFRELQQKTFETGVEQLASVNECVSHLAEIAVNTRYNKKLETIDATLVEMNKKIQADL